MGAVDNGLIAITKKAQAAAQKKEAVLKQFDRKRKQEREILKMMRKVLINDFCSPDSAGTRASCLNFGNLHIRRNKRLPLGTGQVCLCAWHLRISRQRGQDVLRLSISPSTVQSARPKNRETLAKNL